MTRISVKDIPVVTKAVRDVNKGRILKIEFEYNVAKTVEDVESKPSPPDIKLKLRGWTRCSARAVKGAEW